MDLLNYTFETLTVPIIVVTHNLNYDNLYFSSDPRLKIFENPKPNTNAEENK